MVWKSGNQSCCSSSSSNSSVGPSDDDPRPHNPRAARINRSATVFEPTGNDDKSIGKSAEFAATGDGSGYLLTHSPFAVRFNDAETDLENYIIPKIEFDNKPIYRIDARGAENISTGAKNSCDSPVEPKPRRVTVIARISSWKMLLSGSVSAIDANTSVETVKLAAHDALKQLFGFYEPNLNGMVAAGSSESTVTVRPLVAVTLSELKTVQQEFSSFPPAVRFLLASRRTLFIQCSSLAETREACAWLEKKFFDRENMQPITKKIRWQYMFNRTIVEVPIDSRVTMKDVHQFWLNVWKPLREQATLRQLGRAAQASAAVKAVNEKKAPAKVPLHLNLNLALGVAKLDFSQVSASQLDILFAGESAKFIGLPPTLFDDSRQQSAIRADSAWASLLRLQAVMRHPKRFLMFDVPVDLTTRASPEKASFTSSMQQTQETILRIGSSRPSNFLADNNSNDGRRTRTFLDVDLSVRTHHNRIQYPLLLPAVNVTESNYISWENDMTKYIAYRNAVLEAVKRRSVESDVLTVFVVGPGRGRFIFYAIDACQRLGIPPSKVAIYAVEKNPNGIKAIMKRFEVTQEANTKYTNSSTKIDLLELSSGYEPQSVLRGRYCVEETGAHEFNVSESPRDGYFVELIYGDYRNWSGPQSSGKNVLQADIVISELLGAVGCNELAPECLATQPATGGRCRPITKPDAVFIPKSFTSFIMPIMSADLERNLVRLDPQLLNRYDLYSSMQLARRKGKVLKASSAPEYGQREAPQSVWETCSGVFLPLAEPQQLFHFDFPDSGELKFERQTDLKFTISSSGGQVHGFLAYFKAAIDDQHEISLCPFDGKCRSWGQIFFPARDESKSVVARGDQLCLSVSRKADDEYVWYEWRVRHGDVQTVNNADGGCFSIPLYGQSTNFKPVPPRPLPNARTAFASKDDDW